VRESLEKKNFVRFEVFTAVTMKNGVFWNVTRATQRNIPEDTILELYGLRGKIHMWLSSYLTDRTQFVEIQHVDQKTSNLMSYSSSLREMKHGIPQVLFWDPYCFYCL
jgi:hypothetical protein